MAKEFEKVDYKRKYNFYSIMGIIGDILFYPIIIITLLCCFAIYTDKQKKEVPSLLGISMVSISSGSMIKGGFDIHEIVFLHKENPQNLRGGNIIGFYYTFDSTADAGVNTSTLTLLQSFDRTTNTSSEFNIDAYNEYRNNERVGDRKQIQEFDTKSKPEPFFHRIIAIYIKDDGTLFYRTQGDSNHDPDGKLICEDYIIGEYAYTPKFIRSAFAFVATPTGMVVLVVVPLSILSLFILFSIIEQISKIMIEKRVLSRLIRYNEKESIDANIGFDMEVNDKAWFYATAEEEDKNGVASFLWGYLKFGKKEQIGEYDSTMHALKYLETDPKKYWLFFIGLVKGKRRKRAVQKSWQNWSAELELQKKFTYLEKLKKKKNADSNEDNSDNEKKNNNTEKDEKINNLEKDKKKNKKKDKTDNDKKKINKRKK